MKYKVGDKVRVKSLEWYNMNKDEFEKIRCNTAYFQPTMSKLCDSILTIKNIDKFINAYIVEENSYYWTDDMLEGLAEEEIYDEDDIDPLHELCQSKFSAVIIESDVFKDEVELILNGYEIEIRGDKTYAVKKKPKYPKTYEECCKIMGIQPDNIIITNCSGLYGTKYESNLINKFGALWELIICRGAYWKIAGDWKPDWANNYQKKWIINFYQDEINFTNGTNVQFILAFPTKEMRDLFYEKFKDLIEKCNELL